ncbi:hypothetical protein O181_073867 [Austropuccinia psidii MF-1]|uniref:Uncharacterized protein n=1 Tax=Austropuccinia psidii MF-1 TaxID=1389203 RepID=A0A9Q3FC06_9BASI|nr:hypothetical protein [Austropuccinia psidii MF-1]
MVSSHELGIEVEGLSHESNPDPPVLQESQPQSTHKPNFKSYEKENTVEPCEPTEDAGQDDAQKNQNDSKIPDYVCQKIGVEVGESLPEGSQVVIGGPEKGLGKRPNINATKTTNKKCCKFEAAKDLWYQGDDMSNVEVDHIDNEPLYTESPPIINETIHDEPPPASPTNIKTFQERETIKHDTMGQDMTDIMPDPEPEVSSSTNFQGILLSRIEEFGEILNYHSNITQQSWQRGLDNINSIYKN